MGSQVQAEGQARSQVSVEDEAGRASHPHVEAEAACASHLQVEVPSVEKPCYVHRVAYYETDRMGITHHSNYIRWMEEARVWYLDRTGHSFAALEAAGITSPVLGVSCTYKKPTTFDDEVAIEVAPASIGAARLTIAYTMTNLTSGKLACTGTTEHCFVGPEGRPLRIERDMPAFYEALVAGLDGR